MGKGRESKTKTEIAGALSEEWLSGVCRKLDTWQQKSQSLQNFMLLEPLLETISTWT